MDSAGIVFMIFYCNFKLIVLRALPSFMRLFDFSTYDRTGFMSCY